MTLTTILAALAAPLLAIGARAKADVLGFLAANGLALALKLGPVVAFAAVFGLEYASGDAWAKTRVVALAVASVLATFDVLGKLPAVKPAARTAA